METLNTFPPSAHPKLPLLSIWVNGYPTRGQTSWSHPAPSPYVLSHIESIRNQSMPTPIPLPPNRHLPCSSHAGLILAVPQTCQDHAQLRAFALAAWNDLPTFIYRAHSLGVSTGTSFPMRPP